MIYRNYEGFAHAKDMIAHGKVSHKAFSFKDEDERDLLGSEETDIANHARHHLGIDDDQPFASPKRNRYPFAKGGKVYSRALHGIRNTAHEHGHDDIRDAASHLLGEIKSRHMPEERELIPESRHIVKDGGKYRLYTKDGHKLISTHDTEEGALKQEEAIKAHEADEAGRNFEPIKEVRSFLTEIRVKDTAEGPIIHGYGAVYNRDSQILPNERGRPFIERIHPDAFKRVLASNPDVRALGNHDPNQLLGRTKSGTLKLEHDDNGLRYEIKPPKGAVGEHHLEVIKRGDMDGSSFSFSIDPDGEEWDHSGDVPVRTVKSIRDLFDVGPVTYPAYLDATAAARSLDRFRPEPGPVLPSRTVAQRRRMFSCRFPNLRG